MGANSFMPPGGAYRANPPYYFTFCPAVARRIYVYPLGQPNADIVLLVFAHFHTLHDLAHWVADSDVNFILV